MSIGWHLVGHLVGTSLDAEGTPQLYGERCDSGDYEDFRSALDGGSESRHIAPWNDGS
jgi:hypothetical protein